MARALATLALGTALILTGAAFDTASLYVPGVALTGLVLLAVAWVRLATAGAALRRAPGPPTVVEEEPYPLRVELSGGLVPPPGGELLEPLLGWPVPIAGRRRLRVRINVRFSRRGRRRLEPGLVVVRDPLHLHRAELAERAAGAAAEVLVLPRVEPVRAQGAGAGALGAAEGGPGLAGRRLDTSTAELDIDGLRPYREGSPASRIHWPAVARTGEMLERRMTAELDSAPLVVLDPSRPADGEALDKAVRAAGSLCLHLARSGGCAILLPGDRRPHEVGPELAAWPHVHARLALVEPGGAPPAAARAPRAGSVFWVTGASGPPRALERLAAPARYLVSPSPPPGGRPAFTVAGCAGRALGRSGARTPAAGRAA